MNTEWYTETEIDHDLNKIRYKENRDNSRYAEENKISKVVVEQDGDAVTKLIVSEETPVESDICVDPVSIPEMNSDNFTQEIKRGQWKSLLNRIFELESEVNRLKVKVG